MKKILSISLALCLGIIFSFLVLEIILRVFDPFPTTVRGDKIVLKNNDKKVLKVNHPKLESEIVVTTNHLGFRGENYPADPQNRIKIFTVGGSTTLSLYNTEGKTWSDLLASNLKKINPKIWINNAGLSGHSTKGHLILLKDKLVELKPEYVIFLVGINDVGRVIDEKEESTIEKVLFKSEVISLAVNIIRNFQSKKLNLSYDLNWNPKTAPTLELSGMEISKSMMMHSKTYLPYYRRRLEALIDFCKKNNIKPILMTQPLVYGDQVDPTTGVNLGKFKVGEQNSLQIWLVLEMYNDITRVLARKERIPLVDLAQKMPKDTLYYYDYMHYTDQGAAKVASIVSEELASVLTKPIH